MHRIRVYLGNRKLFLEFFIFIFESIWPQWTKFARTYAKVISSPKNIFVFLEKKNSFSKCIAKKLYVNSVKQLEYEPGIKFSNLHYVCRRGTSRVYIPMYHHQLFCNDNYHACTISRDTALQPGGRFSTRVSGRMSFQKRYFHWYTN